MRINILGADLYVSFLYNEQLDKILAYSIHYTEDKSVKHLNKIKKYHNLSGKIIKENNRLRKWFEKVMHMFFTDKFRADFIDLTIYKNREVYEKLIQVPKGKTITYSELAKISGKNIFELISTLAHNPFLIIIPCHRVIRRDGRIGGYTPLGASFKKRLLEIEGAI